MSNKSEEEKDMDKPKECTYPPYVLIENDSQYQLPKIDCATKSCSECKMC